MKWIYKCNNCEQEFKDHRLFSEDVIIWCPSCFIKKSIAEGFEITELPDPEIYNIKGNIDPNKEELAKHIQERNGLRDYQIEALKKRSELLKSQVHEVEEKIEWLTGSKKTGMSFINQFLGEPWTEKESDKTNRCIRCEAPLSIYEKGSSVMGNFCGKCKTELSQTIGNPVVKFYEKEDYEEFKKDFGEGSEISKEAEYLFSGVDDPKIEVLSRGAMGIPIQVRIIENGNYLESVPTPKPKNRILEWIRGIFK